MESVEPIRDLDALQKCYSIAIEHDRHRKSGEVSWELILVVGLNTSLRVSDFSRLKVSDLKGKDHAQIRAKKTGKEANVLISQSARNQINHLLAGRSPDEYIFQSRKREYGTRKRKPISRQRCYQIINEIARRAGIEGRIGCHTLRKTFGYHYYKKTHDVASLQKLLSHTSPRETLIYIGVIQEEIDDSLKNFNVLTAKRWVYK